ncbi:DMT family transporter [Vibrio hippocampi]|uniref:EamA domain-containing protein n=1 Tax=Vibrio hippocampi TaxID=654686 RepID=A0ABN8DM25_9VIBR|nr:DMT family transporter [Vibrio hippocampi]CAH0529030.1 hypothetical protein VHP8226_03015 [Vibrio hippocampi]
MAYLFAFFTVLIWSGNAIVSKLAATSIEPSAMSFYRWFVAILVMTPFCLRKVNTYRSVIRHNINKIAFLALLGMVLNQSLGYFAALTTTASNMALTSSLVPLLSVFLSVPLLGKRISALSIIGGLISLFGLAYMLGQGNVLFFIHQSVTEGDILMVFAAITYAAYCVLLKRWKLPLPNSVFIYMQGFCALVMLTPMLFSSEQTLPTVASVPLIAYAGLFASIVAPLMWVRAIDMIGADSSAMFMNLLPVITLILASYFLNEHITRFHITGGMLVIGGVIMSQIKLSRLSPRPPAPVA